MNRRPVSSEELRLSVYDGSRLLGHILERDGVRTATTWPNEHLLGHFRTRKAAADAIGAAAILVDADTFRRAA